MGPVLRPLGCNKTNEYFCVVFKGDGESTDQWSQAQQKALEQALTQFPKVSTVIFVKKIVIKYVTKLLKYRIIFSIQGHTYISVHDYRCFDYSDVLNGCMEILLMIVELLRFLNHTQLQQQSPCQVLTALINEKSFPLRTGARTDSVYRKLLKVL